jgi:two-component system, LuxR family, response regulator FixJ
MFPNRTVFVIDDDPDLRASVCALVSSLGCHTQGFASAEEFLASEAPGERGVAVVDLRMPGLSGLELQAELARRNIHLPVVILTAHSRTPLTVRAIQAGAVTVIDKPYHDDDLWDAVRTALEKEEVAWTAEQRRREICDRLATLTAEERRVADLIAAGNPNKMIAQELGIALRTVEKRRQAVLAKMKAESVAELVGLLIEARNSHRP